MTVFLHTADWQIGKPFLHVENDEKRYKLKRERINVIRRIKELLDSRQIDFILVAGDMFDSPLPSNADYLEVLDSIGKLNIPVIVIPGNHDHGSYGSIWKNKDFISYKEDLAPNLNLILENKFIEIKDAIIFACPLLQRHVTLDPTLWLREIDWKKFTQEKTRIVIAHGSTQEFASRDYNHEEFEIKTATNLINLDKLNLTEIDYIALGDWHNLKEVKKNVWYCGTPEQDRYDQGDKDKRGQVLCIESKRSFPPKVESIETGELMWHNLKIKFDKDNDVDKLIEKIELLIRGRIQKDLIRIELDGQLSLTGYQKYKDYINELKNKLIDLRIRGKLDCYPQEEELESLISRIEDPMISSIAKNLDKVIKGSKDKEEISLNRNALTELYRLTKII